MSIGEQLAKGNPVIFTRDGKIPEVVCRLGREKDALELLEKKGIITLVRPVDRGIIGIPGEKVTMNKRPADEKKRPMFVKIDSQAGSALRNHGGASYYRDGGNWTVGSRWKDGELIIHATGHTKHLNGKKLTPCTEAEWRDDNGQYAPKSVT